MPLPTDHNPQTIDGGEVVYDDSAEVEIVGGKLGEGEAIGCAPASSQGDGIGCHAGRETMLEAAKKADNSEALKRYAADYPMGPHDQPQSMCPAFGSLRVGLRMRRTARDTAAAISSTLPPSASPVSARSPWWCRWSTR